VEVPVVSVQEDFVLVDLGLKLEGLIPRREFGDHPPVAGSRIGVLLERRGGLESPTVLSHQKAARILAWQKVVELHRLKQRVRAKVLRRIKGGFLVDVGVPAFLPSSQSVSKSAKGVSVQTGKEIDCYITEIQEERKNVVVSWKRVMEEDEERKRREALGRIHPGQVVEGSVTHLTDFGAFVDISGVEGLLHISDVAWRVPKHVGQVLKTGQKIRVKILKIEPEAGRVSLGRKQLLEHPADVLSRKYRSSQAVHGKIRRIFPKGLVVALKDGDQGFVPQSEISADFKPAEGKEVDAVVVGINRSQSELVLSIIKHEHRQEKLLMKKYMKKVPALTLGEVLGQAERESET